MLVQSICHMPSEMMLLRLFKGLINLYKQMSASEYERKKIDLITVDAGSSLLNFLICEDQNVWT